MRLPSKYEDEKNILIDRMDAQLLYSACNYAYNELPEEITKTSYGRNVVEALYRTAMFFFKNYALATSDDDVIENALIRAHDVMEEEEG